MLAKHNRKNKPVLKTNTEKKPTSNWKNNLYILSSKTTNQIFYISEKHNTGK